MRFAPDLRTSQLKIAQMKRIAITVYLLLLHLALAALLIKTNVAARLGLTAPQENPHIVNMRGIHSWREQTMPDGAAVFLGDSLTERLATAAVAPNSVNFGASWQTSAQLLASMPKSLNRAGAVYLLIGTNDIVSKKQEGLVDRLASIAAAIPPGTPLVWTGIMLAEADQTNAAIQWICKSRQPCTYVPPLTDSSAFDDGVHLSIAGYGQWIAALKSTGREQPVHHAIP